MTNTTTTDHSATSSGHSDSARVRSEIDDTRERLGQTVDAIGDRVLPGRIIERRKESTANRLRGLRDRVMGPAQHAREEVTGSAGSTVDHLRDAPASVAQRTEGSPLAVGGVAFAIGFLAAAVWRPTAPERQAVEKVADAAPEVTAGIADVGREVAAAVKDEAIGAAEELKASVTEAGTAVKSAATNDDDESS